MVSCSQAAAAECNIIGHIDHSEILRRLAFFVSLHVLSLYGLQTIPIITGHICGQKLMGGCPRDEPAATVCFSLRAAKTPRGHANMRCPGDSHRDASLHQG